MGGSPYVYQLSCLQPFLGKSNIRELLNSHGTAGIRKLVNRGTCKGKSAWRPSIVSQDTTQSLWDPTVGSPRHPGSSKTQLGIFYRFPTKFALPNARAGAHSVFFATPKTACGGPCGQTNALIPSTVSYDTIESVWDPTLGSLGHPRSGKIRKIPDFTCFR